MCFTFFRATLIDITSLIWGPFKGACSAPVYFPSIPSSIAAKLILPKTEIFAELREGPLGFNEDTLHNILFFSDNHFFASEQLAISTPGSVEMCKKMMNIEFTPMTPFEKDQ